MHFLELATLGLLAAFATVGSGKRLGLSYAGNGYANEDEHAFWNRVLDEGGSMHNTETPTSSPSPTPGCAIDATAGCIIANGTSCSLLTTLPMEKATCVLPNGPTELGWIYRGNNCEDNRTDFDCLDLNGGPNANPSVNIMIRNKAGIELFQETGVLLNGLLIIPSSTGADLDEISVTIYTGANETEDGALQTMSSIKTRCKKEDGFTLGTAYGAFEFASYRNNEQFAQAVQPVEWQYSVINTGLSKAFLTQMIANTNGNILTLNPGAPLEAGESVGFTIPSEISLLAAGSYTGEVSVTAMTSEEGDDPECVAAANSTVSVGV